MHSVFIDRGISVLMLDLRGHGKSTPAFVTFGDKERNDILVGWTSSPKSLTGPKKKVGCLALSMGATAAYLAAMEAGKSISHHWICLFSIRASPMFRTASKPIPRRTVGGAIPSLFSRRGTCRLLPSGADFEDANPMADTADTSNSSPVDHVFLGCGRALR